MEETDHEEDARGQRMAVTFVRYPSHGRAGRRHHQESPDAVVEEDSSGYDKHSKAKELVKLIPH